jgi:GMP synthase-like glutamine amidotransferase
MNFLAILHASYEGPGLIKEWISTQNHRLEAVFAWDLPTLSSPPEFDALIIMGGPMSVNDEEKHPWLVHEKEFILDAIDDGKKVLGICLGSQLLANCLGSKVYRNQEPEIGWFPVKKKFFMHSWFPVFDENEKVPVFHWHGDTFDIPEGGVPLFESEGCRNQAFAVDDQILALQFHPEVTEEVISAFIEHGRGDLRPAHFIQSEARMLSNYKLYGETSKALLFDLLDDFFTE